MPVKPRANKPAQQAEPVPEKTPEDCITEDCYKPAESRGLCQACYKTAQRYVKRGRVTWKQLEEHGLIRPSRNGEGYGRLGPMSLSIERALGRAPKA